MKGDRVADAAGAEAKDEVVAGLAATRISRTEHKLSVLAGPPNPSEGDRLRPFGAEQRIRDGVRAPVGPRERQEVADERRVEENVDKPGGRRRADCAWGTNREEEMNCSCHSERRQSLLVIGTAF